MDNIRNVNYDDLLHEHIIKQLESLQDSQLDDKYFRKLADVVIKSLLDSVCRRRYTVVNDEETKKEWEKAHASFVEMVNNKK